MLLLANWKDGRVEGLLVPRGSLVSSFASIAAKTGLTVEAARVAIKHLKTTGEITSKSTNRFTIYHIVKYEDFQVSVVDDTSETPSKTTNEPQADNKRTTTTEKSNKGIKKEEVPLSSGPPPSSRKKAHPLFAPSRKKFEEAWRSRYGTEYYWFGARDATFLNSLLSYADRNANGSDPLEVIGNTITAYLKDNDDLQKKNQHPLSTLAKAPQKWWTLTTDSDKEGGVKFTTLPGGSDYARNENHS